MTAGLKVKLSYMQETPKALNTKNNKSRPAGTNLKIIQWAICRKPTIL
jgi:hypothetical protein